MRRGSPYPHSRQDGHVHHPRIKIHPNPTPSNPKNILLSGTFSPSGMDCQCPIHPSFPESGHPELNCIVPCWDAQVPVPLAGKALPATCMKSLTCGRACFFHSVYISISQSGLFGLAVWIVSHGCFRFGFIDGLEEYRNEKHCGS